MNLIEFTLLIIFNRFIFVSLHYLPPFPFSPSLSALSFLFFSLVLIFHFFHTFFTLFFTLFPHSFLYTFSSRFFTHFFLQFLGTLAFGNSVYLLLNVGFIQMLKSFTPVIIMITACLARIENPTWCVCVSLCLYMCMSIYLSVCFCLFVCLYICVSV